MHRSAELHLHRGGPFVRLAMCATLVYLAASLRVSPTRLRPRFLPPLSLYSFPSSLLPFPFFLPALVSLLNVAPLSFVLHASTRKTAGALPPLLSSPLFLSRAANNALPRWSAAI